MKKPKALVNGMNYEMWKGCLAVLSVCLSMSGPGMAVANAPAVPGGKVWRVESIDNGGVTDRSMITIDLLKTGRVAGSTGCNRYFGNVTVEKDTLATSGIATTRRACAPALMHQERRFVDALNDATGFTIEKDTWFVIFDADGKERLRAIAIDSDPSAVRSKPQDMASETPIVFDCENREAIRLRFVGPETIELTVDGVRHVLTRERTASGARYRKDGLEFWNKGDEALLMVGEQRYTCKRR